MTVLKMTLFTPMFISSRKRVIGFSNEIDGQAREGCIGRMYAVLPHRVTFSPFFDICDGFLRINTCRLLRQDSGRLLRFCRSGVTAC
jgi:hypothetical protein